MKFRSKAKGSCFCVRNLQIYKHPVIGNAEKPLTSFTEAGYLQNIAENMYVLKITCSERKITRN